MSRALLFLGCTVPVRNLGYEASARKVAERLGVELVDDAALGCCGFPLKAADSRAALTIAARGLAQAQAHGLPLVPLCSACAGTLAEAAHLLDHDEGLRAEINRRLEPTGLAYEGPVAVRHLVRYIWEEVGPEAIKAAMTKSLEGYVFAPHYGCHYLKPSEVLGGFDDPEDPRSLARLIETTGAQSLDYTTMKACCGGGVLGADEDLAGSLAGDKLFELAGVEGLTAMAVVCPFCNVMYEGQQKAIFKKAGRKDKVPVVYVTQVLGLGLGFSPEELGMKLNRVKPKELIKAFSG